MRRGFLLPRHTQKRSGVTQPAATSMHLSTEASELAGIVLSRHASHLAILLGDSSVLYLCRDQDRKEACLQQQWNLINRIYKWTKPLDIAMSQGRLPLSGAAPSAFILRQFPQLMELCFDKESKNSEPLFAQRWEEMFDCMTAGLHAFQVEGQDGIEIDEAWLNYYESNEDRVLEWAKCINRFWPVHQQCTEERVLPYREPVASTRSGYSGDTILLSQFVLPPEVSPQIECP